MWPALAFFAAAVMAAVWLAARWGEKRFDHHVESALALTQARDRHPAVRGRCRCGRYMTPFPLPGAGGDPEPFTHSHDCCQPIREAL